jgi:AbiV family abortive infection protein
VNEAKLLCQNGHYARAYALATLAYEELGKALMISKLIWVDGSDTKGLGVFWRRFSSHKLKIGNSMLLLAWYAVDRDRWKWLKRRFGDLQKAQQAVKEQSLYVDYRDKRFVLPSEEFMGPTPDARTQIRISEWTLGLLRTVFPSEEVVIVGFKRAIAEARRAGYARIKYEDRATFLKMMMWIAGVNIPSLEQSRGE